MKFFVLAAVLAVANAGNIGYAAAPVAYQTPLAYSAPVVTKTYAAPAVHTYAAPAPLAYSAPVAVAKTVVQEEYDPNPQYSYGYDINDGLTGDSKSQSETRNGDSVQGSYSLTDADGHRRTVDYTADPIHGFNAVVRREPLHVKAVAPVVAKVAAPVAYAAPAYAKVAAPFAYGAQTYAAAPAYYH